MEYFITALLFCFAFDLQFDYIHVCVSLSASLFVIILQIGTFFRRKIKNKQTEKRVNEGATELEWNSMTSRDSQIVFGRIKVDTWVLLGSQRK